MKLDMLREGGMENLALTGKMEEKRNKGRTRVTQTATSAENGGSANTL